MGKTSKTVAVFEQTSRTVALVRLPGRGDWVEYVTSSERAFKTEVVAWCESHGATRVLEVWT